MSTLEPCNLSDRYWKWMLGLTVGAFVLIAVGRSVLDGYILYQGQIHPALVCDQPAPTRARP